MTEHSNKTTARTTVLTIAILSCTMSSFAEEAASFDAEFFSLDGVYERAFASETTSAGSERTSVASDDQAVSFQARATSERRPDIISSQPFTVRVVGDSPNDGMFKTAGVGMFLASAADLTSTELGLGRAGIHELNPVQTNRFVRISTHVAAPAVAWWLTERVRRQGKPKLALFMRIGFAVAYSYAVMHNVRTIRSAP